MPGSGTETGDTVVRLVDELLSRAIGERVSDVHFEPTDTHMLVRYRLDGLLHDVEELPSRLAENIIARLKVLAGLLTYRIDIPQEGSFKTTALADKMNPAKDSAGLDLRVATFPTIRGERAVVRLLYWAEGIKTLDDLGLPRPMVERLRRVTERPAGMILVTGPAGAGKSTTLYALVRRILTAMPGRSIVTLEDPVEQRVDGLTQIQIAPHGELDYARAMRSLLRQDPQVLLVGEVRDAKTADTIVEAALTGHLLLTTMHSGDPAEAVVRLLEMGIPPYQVVSVLSVVCSQRLLRTLCTDCRKATNRPEEPFVHAGCALCHDTGYRGRTACGELFTLDDTTRRVVLSHASADELRQLSHTQGPSLADDAARLVREGKTDIAEAQRVIGESIERISSFCKNVRATHTV